MRTAIQGIERLQKFSSVTLAALLVACGESTGPEIRADDVFVHVAGTEFPIERDVQQNFYKLSFDWTLVNDSSLPLFVNGFCFHRLQRLEGGVWTDVPPVYCSNGPRRRFELAPYSRKNYSSSWASGGPIPPPAFSEAGTYRLKVNLYYDYSGKRPVPDDIGYSSAFQVVAADWSTL